jgi:acetolactate synthase-1/2/3 large subunit
MVIEALADQGVKHLFGYPGGAVLPIYDAMRSRNAIRSASRGLARSIIIS